MGTDDDPFGPAVGAGVFARSGSGSVTPLRNANRNGQLDGDGAARRFDDMALDYEDYGSSFQRRPRRGRLYGLAGWVCFALLGVYTLFHGYGDWQGQQPAATAAGSIPGKSNSKWWLPDRLQGGSGHTGAPDEAVHESVHPSVGHGDIDLVPSLPPPHVESNRFGDWSSYKSLFFFGDSYTAINFDFIYGEQPSAKKPLGAAPEGLLHAQNWPFFLTLKHNHSLLLSYNFAAGGSTVDRSLVSPYIMGLDFKEELANFVKYYTGPEAKATWDPETSMFFIWFGTNDVLIPRYQHKPDPNLKDIFVSYKQTIDKLYQTGARRFLLFTVAPAYRGANDMDQEYLLPVVEDMAAFNSRVFEMKSKLMRQYPDAVFAAFDAHSFWARVIESPQDFAETTDVQDVHAICEEEPVENGRATTCSDGEPLRTHIWSGIHGTYVIHNATAARVVRDCFEPAGKRGFCF